MRDARGREYQKAFPNATTAKKKNEEEYESLQVYEAMITRVRDIHVNDLICTQIALVLDNINFLASHNFFFAPPRYCTWCRSWETNGRRKKKRLDLIVIPIEYVTRLGKATACLVSNKADFTAVRTLYTQSVPLKQGSPVYTEKPHFLLPSVLGSPVVYKLTISRLRITN